MRRAIAGIALIAFATVGGCGSEPTSPATKPTVPTLGAPARIIVNPGDTTIDVGADVPLRVFVYDAAGLPITSPSVSATTDKADVASITAPVTVSANTFGKATITVTVGGVSSSIRVTIIPHLILLPFLPGSKTAAISAMNDAGVAVGTTYDDAGRSSPRAFRYSTSGGIQDLSSGLNGSHASGVNAAGVIAGWAATSGVSNIATWSPAGTATLYGGAFGYGGGAYGSGINNAGQIAANFNYLIPGFGVVSHSGRFDTGTRTMTDVFAAVPNGNGAAIGISDSGTVLGYGTLPGGQSSAFVWSPKTGVSTVPLKDGRLVTVTAISPNNSMAGYAGVVGGGNQAALFSPAGQITLLPTFGDSLTLLPQGVSDDGAVVGRSSTFLGWPEHALYWRKDVGLFDFSALTAAGARALGLNPSGTIVFGSIDDTLQLAGPYPGTYNERPCLWILRRR